MRSPLDRMKIRPLQFGKTDPISNTFGIVRVNKDGSQRAHQGWDLLAAPGTPVFAIASGTVRAGFDGKGYGYWLSLKFSEDGRTYFAFYGHLSEYATNAQNQSVAEGDLIALTGMSGNARGIPLREAHLHFEIRTVEFPHSGPPGHRHPLAGRVDPGELLGYQVYSSHA